LNPHIIVGTANRTLDFIRRGFLDTAHIKHFIVDEFSSMFKSDARDALLQIFRSISPGTGIGTGFGTGSSRSGTGIGTGTETGTVHGPGRVLQVMLLDENTLSYEALQAARRLCECPEEYLGGLEPVLALHGLLQFYAKVPNEPGREGEREEEAKRRMLLHYLETLEFNQVLVYASNDGKVR
jgi:superfamily II DNA/RNA helicase